MKLSDRTGETAIEQVGENFQVQGTPLVRKGDVWLANLGASNFVGCEQKGYRPVVVIQNERGNKFSPTVIVAGVTSKVPKKPLPTHQEIYLYKNSIVTYEQIKTIDKHRLKKFIGHMDTAEMKEMETRLLYSFGILMSPNRDEL